MARFIYKRDESKGQSPGSLIFIGKRKMESVKIRVMDYDKDILTEDEPKTVAEVRKYLDSDSVSWINIYGLHDKDVIQEMGELFNLHPLLLEDVMNTDQRPKIEESDHSLFFVLKMLRYDNEEQIIISEQLSMVVGPKFLLTFQEQPGDVFEPLRERIRKLKGRIRKSGVDYLAYAILDIVVDNYISIIEKFGAQIEDLEEEVLIHAKPEILERIITYKHEMNYLRKTVRPLNEAMFQLMKLEGEHIKKETVPFLKDLQDLIIHASEAVDTYREMLTEQLNIYNSSLSNRMNDIMKLLTIFAAIFIPLTFIAGIYGTNFDYLPELHYKYSYFIFWGVMVTVAISLLIYFKRKGWL